MGEDLVNREQESALQAAGAKIDETSLTFANPDVLTFQHFVDLTGLFLAPIGKGYPWWVGDMLNMAEDLFGEEAYQLEALLPNSPQTCANYKSIAKHVPRSRRRGLHLTVAAEVAYMPPRERDELIQKAVTEGWKREEMREHARAARIIAAGGNPDVLPSPPKKTCPNCGHALED